MIVIKLLSGEKVSIRHRGDEEEFLKAMSSKDANATFHIRKTLYYAHAVCKQWEHRRRGPYPRRVRATCGNGRV